MPTNNLNPGRFDDIVTIKREKIQQLFMEYNVYADQKLCCNVPAKGKNPWPGTAKATATQY